MALFTSPKCPACADSISLWGLWIRGNQTRIPTFWFQKVGVQCPHCGAEAVVVKRWSIIGSILSMIVGIAVSLGVAFYFLESRTTDTVFALMVVPLVLSCCLPLWLSPRLLRLRPLRLGETVLIQVP